MTQPGNRGVGVSGPGGKPGGTGGPAPAPPPLNSEQTIRHLALQEAVKTWTAATNDEQMVSRARAFADFINGDARTTSTSTGGIFGE